MTKLGRPLTNSASTVNIIEPGTEWGDRLNQIDFRFSKILDAAEGAYSI